VKPGSVCDETICHTDLFATATAILGAKVPDGAGEDSASLVPLLKGEKPDRIGREAVVHQAADGTLAIRQGKWKLIFGGPPDAPVDELYDLAADLGETKNVAVDHPEEVTRLTKLMERLIADGRSTPGAKQSNDVKTPLRITQPKKK
jgi:arylsulfatase A